MIRPVFTPQFWGKETYGSSRTNKRSKNSDDVELSIQTIGARPSRLPFGKPRDPYNTTALATGNESEEKIIDDGKSGSVSAAHRDTTRSGSRIVVKHTVDQTSTEMDLQHEPLAHGIARWNPV